MKNLTMAFAVFTANAALEVYSKFEKALTKTFPIAAMVLVFAGFALTANAAVFTVTTTNDSGAGSLRQAVLDANAAAGADTINFSQNVFSGPLTITLTAEIPITSDLTIEGIKTREFFISGSGLGRIFNITNANVQLNNLTLVNGFAASPANGGAILINDGTTTLNNSIIFSCSSTANGGAIYVQSGNLVVQNSTITVNNASLSGGGIFINNLSAHATIVSSTIAYNGSNQSAGGLFVSNGTAAIKNSIFAGNTSPSAPDVLGIVNSQGYNLLANSNGAALAGDTTGNQLNVSPMLSFLTTNGGATRTLSLQAGSPAIDAGDPALAGTTDQRQARRNTDGNYNGVPGVDIGAYEKQRSAFDNDGDGMSDLSVTRIANQTDLFWYGGIRVFNSRPENLIPSPNGLSIQRFGLIGDVPTPGDYDGDGKLDAAVFRPTEGNWYINGSTTGVRVQHWGVSGDIPVPADYDGDGKTDLAVYRSGTWYIFKSLSGFTGEIILGDANAKPVPADYDGDLKADVAIFNNGNWTINRSTGGQTSAQFGLAADVPAAADYNGDGSDELAVFRPADGTWYIQRPNGGYDAVPFGLATDKLVPADYDGDGKTDIAVWRSNTTSGRGDWYLLQSRDGYIQANFGFSTDFPIINSNIRQ